VSTPGGGFQIHPRLPRISPRMCGTNSRRRWRWKCPEHFHEVASVTVIGDHPRVDRARPRLAVLERTLSITSTLSQIFYYTFRNHVVSHVHAPRSQHRHDRENHTIEKNFFYRDGAAPPDEIWAVHFRGGSRLTTAQWPPEMESKCPGEGFAVGVDFKQRTAFWPGRKFFPPTGFSPESSAVTQTSLGGTNHQISLGPWLYDLAASTCLCATTNANRICAYDVAIS